MKFARLAGIFGKVSAFCELDLTVQGARGLSGSWSDAGGFWSQIDRILGDALALAARVLYCSHSMESENGGLLWLATAEAYEKGLERPTWLDSWSLVDSGFL